MKLKQKRTALVKGYVTDEHKDALQAACAAKGKSVSDVLRSLGYTAEEIMGPQPERASPRTRRARHGLDLQRAGAGRLPAQPPQAVAAG